MSAIYEDPIRAMAAAVLLLLLTGCGGGGGGKTASTPVPAPSATMPVIATHPQNQSVLAGASASFSVTATGSAPLQYQWRRNGTDVSGATGSTFTLAAVALDDDGDTFSVAVSNSAGSVASTSAQLTVTAPTPPAAIAPRIDAQPQDQSALVGGSVSFSVSAGGTEPLLYQWHRDGVAIAGATSSTLALVSLSMADHGSSVHVVVSNSAGSVTSASVKLTVTTPPPVPDPPIILQQPQSMSVVTGDSAAFSVSAGGTPPLHYQWRRGGVDISGANGTTFTVPATTLEMSGQTYSVVVSSAHGSITSDQAVLTVTHPPVVAATLDLAANDLIYDALRNLIYASVPTNDSIAIINPSTGMVSSYVPVGNNPGVLAISDDGRYLYVGLVDDSQVQRVDLAASEVDLTITLDSTRYAEDIEVLPGAAASIAVTQKYKNITPRFAGIAVFDGAVRRTQTSSSMSGPIEFGAGTRLYGYDNQTSAYSLHRMTVGPSGLTTNASQMNLIMGIDVDIKYEEGLMYSTSGSLVNPETFVLLGEFSVDGTAVAVRPDATNDRAYFLAKPAAHWQVQAFDATEFVPTGFVQTNDTAPSAGSLIRCGGDGLAFRTSGAKIHIVAVASLQPPPAAIDPGAGVMSVATNDLIYDAQRDLIYASVPGNVYSIGNSVLAIDPVTETVVHRTFVGSKPNQLALSDDAQYLYVSLEGAPRIQRIDLDSFTNDQTIMLSPFGRGIRVDDLQVVPGQANVIAVARKSCCSTPSQRGIAMYESGVQRPDTTMGLNDSTVIAFGASAGRLYGYDARSSWEHGLRRMNVSASGVVVADVTAGLMTGAASELKHDGGQVYVNDRAIDPESLTITHTFAVTGSPLSVAPDSANNRVYILASAPAGTWRIEAFDASSAAAEGAITVSDSASSAGSLVRWGADGLAFRTNDGRIYLLHLADLQ